MNTGSVLSISSEKQRLELLSKAVRFISCGKLNRGSQLLSEATREGDSDDMRNMINECRSLGLLVQARRCLRRADEFLLAGAYQDSLDCFNKVPSAIMPVELSFQIFHNKGVCLVRLSRYTEAVPCFEEARTLMPGNSIVLQNLAFALMLVNEYEAALHVFAEVIRNDDVPPTSLLHVLYGSAACRQRLYDGNRENDQFNSVAVENDLRADDLRADDDSYNDYPLGADFGTNIQNVAHHIVEDSNVSLKAPILDFENFGAHEAPKTFIPFRRLQYRGVSSASQEVAPEIKSTAAEPLQISHSIKTIGSPSAILSREKREELRRAVNSYDRSALPSAASEVGMVSAQKHTLPPRLRATDPSPGAEPHALHKLRSEALAPTVLQTAEGKVGSTAVGVVRLNAHTAKSRSAAQVNDAESVSSVKPALAVHRARHPAEFQLPSNVSSTVTSPRSPTHTVLTSTSTASQLAPVASFLSAPPSALPKLEAIPRIQPHGVSPAHSVSAVSADTAHVIGIQLRELSVRAEVGQKAAYHDHDVTTGDSPVDLRSAKPARKRNLHFPNTARDDEGKKSVPLKIPFGETNNVGKTEQADWSATNIAPAAPSTTGAPAEPIAHAPLPSSLASAQRISTPPNKPQCATLSNYVTESEKLEPDMVMSGAPACASTPVDQGQASSKPTRPARLMEAVPATSLVLIDGEAAESKRPAHASFERRVSPADSTYGDHRTTGPQPVTEAVSSASASSITLRQTSFSSPVVATTAPNPILSLESPAVPHNSLCHSSNTSISGISGDSYMDPSGSDSLLRMGDTYMQYQSQQGSEASEQQQEMNRVFESRRYVDEFTFTSLDVMRLRLEQASSTSGPPSSVTQFFALPALQSPGPFPAGVDVRYREYFLSDEQFAALFHCSKAAWAAVPAWRQRNLKKTYKLF